MEWISNLFLGLLLSINGLFGIQSEQNFGNALQTFSPSIIPLTDSRYYLGTTSPSTNAWASGIFDQLCLTGDVCRTTWPSGSGSTAYEIATTTDIAISQIAYFTKTGGLTTLGSVATGTVSSANSALTVTANRSVLGGSLVLTIASTTNSLFTGTAGQVLGYTNLGWQGVATTTFSGGLTYSAGNVTNTLTAGDGITRNTDDLDCDIASGSVFGCLSTTDWTTFNNSVDPTRALTVAGTAKQITSSAGAQDLSADRTWTLSLPSFVHFPGDFLATNSTTTNATTTSLYVTGLTSALALFDSNSRATEYTGIDCTNQFVRDVDAAGAGTCATVGASDVSLANLTATDSTLTFSGTYNGSTARTIGLNLGNANTWTALQQFGNATTSLLTVSGTATSTWLRGTIDIFGGMVGIGGTATTTIRGNNATSTFAGGVFATRLNTSGTSTFAGVDLSSGCFAVLGTCISLSGGGIDDPFSHSTFWGQSVSGTTTALRLTGTPFSIFASSTAAFQSLTTIQATTTHASTTNQTISGNTWLSGITSALVLTGSDGLVAEYTGIDCTNQFVRDVSALGAGTCATVTGSDVNLGDLTAGNTSLTLSGTYDGQTAQTIVLNVGNANTWTAAQTFNIGAGAAGILSNSLVGIGTTTPKWPLTVASSTGPQITLTDTSLTNAPFNFRAKNNTLYISTSTPGTFATTSSAIAFFDSNTASSTFLKLDVNGVATSTFNRGINIAGGCFAVTGTCLNINGSGAGALPGTLGVAQGGTGLTATPTFGQILRGTGSGYALVATSTLNVALGDTTGTLAINRGGTATTTFYNGGVTYYNSTLATQSQGRNIKDFFFDTERATLGIGTSTPKWNLQIASSTRSQLTLSDASLTSNHWSLRSINNWLYFSTSTPAAGFATSTRAHTLAFSSGGLVFASAQQPATSTAIKVDWGDTPNQVELRIGTAATTINIVNATTSGFWGSTKRVLVCNPGTTAGAVTWGGVLWSGGTAPTQTTTADKCDLYSFVQTRATSSSAYVIMGAGTTNF